MIPRLNSGGSARWTVVGNISKDYNIKSVKVSERVAAGSDIIMGHDKAGEILSCSNGNFLGGNVIKW